MQRGWWLAVCEALIEAEGEKLCGNLGAEARVLMDTVTGQHIHMQVPGSCLCSSLAEGKVGGKSHCTRYRSYRVTPRSSSL